MDLKRLYSKLESLRKLCTNSAEYDIQDRMTAIGSFLNNDLCSAIDAVDNAISKIEELEDTIKDLNSVGGDIDGR